MFFAILSATCHPDFGKPLYKGDTRWWQMGGRWQIMAFGRSTAHGFVCKGLSFPLFSLRENDVFPQGKRCILSGKTT